MISLNTYPGLQNMSVFLEGTLYELSESGELSPDDHFNQRFGRELAIFNDEFQKNMRAHCLGWVLPSYPKSGHTAWTDSSSIFFSRNTLLSLQTFEKAIQRFSSANKGPRFGVTEEMSVYEGMRRLSAYGVVLGYYPAITLGTADELAVVNMRIRNRYARSELFHNALVARTLESKLFEACKERPFLKTLLAEITSFTSTFAFADERVFP